MSLAKPVHKDLEIDGFRLHAGVDGYMRTMEVGITRPNGDLFIPLCTVTNGVGHCCAVNDALQAIASELQRSDAARRALHPVKGAKVGGL